LPQVIKKNSRRNFREAVSRPRFENRTVTSFFSTKWSYLVLIAKKDEMVVRVALLSEKGIEFKFFLWGNPKEKCLIGRKGRWKGKVYIGR
jgi:hypothetical protein